MGQLQQQSERVGFNLRAAGFQIDPLTILAVITALVQLFKGCGLSPSIAARRAAHPKLLDRLVARRMVRKHAPGQDEEAILAAVLDAGAVLTTKEVKEMFAECGAESGEAGGVAPYVP